MALARLIRTVTGLVALVIVLGILLFVLSANPHNAIVSDIHDAANWLVGPFRNVFSVKGPKLNLALNWGLATLVYLVVGGFLASLAARSTARGRRFGRVRPVA
jgi:YGGT family